MLAILIIIVVLLSRAFSSQAQSFTVPPDSIPSDERTEWCEAQVDTCNTLCGNETNANQCDPNDLTYQCICQGGSSPDLSQWNDTIPSFECQAYKSSCPAENPNVFGGQSCDTITCGSLSATTSFEQSSSSSSATSGQIDSAPASLTDSLAGFSQSSAPLSTSRVSPSSSSSSLISPSPTTAATQSRSEQSGSTSSVTSTPTALSSQSSSSGLGGGAVAGIVVGSLVGVCLVALLAFCVWRRRKTDPEFPIRLDPEGKQVVGGDDGYAPKPELEATPAPRANTVEIDGNTTPLQQAPSAADPMFDLLMNSNDRGESTQRCELPSSNRRPRMQELDSDPLFSPAELSASRAHSRRSAVTPRRTQADGSDLPEAQPTSNLSEPIPGPEATGEAEVTVRDDATPDEIARLEGEVRRIDAELAEATRIKTLRQERTAVEERLREARERKDGPS
ncbi:hypothetical protein EV356DRAFT_531550 [Viridothelium virens]|uniref:DUF7707 domain-containing protein n=1 Tax=Viridothelium virens TaxID=1048519 RepID=A0A6A6HCW2_VIRVR|nr:hypothetical protein EV356DRAFT_531550 [Viridothelium virens]